jgi:hypothetical protein
VAFQGWGVRTWLVWAITFVIGGLVWCCIRAIWWVVGLLCDGWGSSWGAGEGFKGATSGWVRRCVIGLFMRDGWEFMGWGIARVLHAERWLTWVTSVGSFLGRLLSLGWGTGKGDKNGQKAFIVHILGAFIHSLQLWGWAQWIGDYQSHTCEQKEEMH